MFCCCFKHVVSKKLHFQKSQKWFTCGLRGTQDSSISKAYMCLCHENFGVSALVVFAFAAIKSDLHKLH